MSFHAALSPAAKEAVTPAVDLPATAAALSLPAAASPPAVHGAAAQLQAEGQEANGDY